jgi:hypothetical protein
MATYLCPEFVRDLIQHNDAHFASRVLSKVIGSDGEFASDADDHRYNGIEGGWIRYISRQNTAYRAIFIRRGSDIYWYRAGGHSIENRLQSPRELVASVTFGEVPAGLDLLTSHRNPRYLKTSEPRLLREVLASRVLVPHRSISFITPRLSPTLFNSPGGLIGRLISSVLESSGTVTLITKPPNARELTQYRWLVSRGVDLLVHRFVNARLFLFEIDRDRLHSELTHLDSVGVIGSSELTEAGLGLSDATEIHEELCYEIAGNDLDGSMEFLLKLAGDALSLENHLQRFALQ